MSENWDAVSKAVLERDNHACRDCGNPKNPQVHHIIPRRFGGGDSEENLITLCPRHHKKHDNQYLRVGTTRYLLAEVRENLKLKYNLR